MKKIKIFIASSVEELRAERQALGSFVTGLNNRLIDRGFFCQLSLCDNEDQAMPAGGRKQDEYNKIIADSDAVFVLFFKKAGSYTVEELDFARECYRRSGHPKVYVYFKDFSEADLTDSARAVYDRIVNDYQHFFGTFENVATIEVDIMRTMFDITLEPSLEVREQGGVIYLGNEEIMSADELDYIQNNKSIEKLKAQIAGLRTGDPDYTDGLYGEEIDEEIEKCEKRLKERYDSCFRALEARYKSMANASRLDIELQAAYNASAKGDYKEVLNILSREKLQNETRKAVEEVKISQKRYLETTFNKYLQRISALDGLCDFAALEEAYDDVISAINEMRLYETEALTVWYNGVSYLTNQNKTQKALEYAEMLLAIYRLAPNAVGRHDKARLYALMGIVYFYQKQPKKAEEYYLKAIELYEILVGEGSEKYGHDLSRVYGNLGVLYLKQKELDKAERYCLKGIEMTKGRVSQASKSKCDLAMSYTNIAILYVEKKEHSKAEKYYLEAIELYRIIVDESPSKYAENLAATYNNTGHLYFKQGLYSKAEKYYFSAMILYEELAKMNFIRNRAELAGCYNNIGNLYKDQGEHEKAKPYLLKAIAIREELAKGNPERYNGELALSYFNFGIYTKSLEYLMKGYMIAKDAVNDPLCRKIVEDIKSRLNI